MENSLHIQSGVVSQIIPPLVLIPPPKDTDLLRFTEIVNMDLCFNLRLQL